MRLAALLIAVSAAAPALAQERTPTERQSLLDLSYALGESHALRQACQGADDQYWRQRMVRLTDTEAADEAFDAQLRGRFNTGYAAGQAQHPSCDRETRRAAATVAARGQALARRLASVMRNSAQDRTMITEFAPE
ncbi:MAG: TIGR02301 family protein [Caulobacterales bacterium]|nr:TIGR02301 family protein [Caulobacterales bacterium]